MIKAELMFHRGIQRILVYGDVGHLDFVGYTSFFDCGKYLVEVNAFNIILLKKIPAAFEASLQQLYQRMYSNVTSDSIVVRTEKPLLPFQLSGVTFLHVKKGRALLADEMGLGKTIQVLGLLTAFPVKYSPLLVICPAHVKLNWKDEIEAFVGTCCKVQVLFGRNPERIQRDAQIVITNSHILEAWEEELQRMQFKWTVIDEAHNFVSTKTKTYEIVKRIIGKIGRTCLLSGTPLINQIDDLWGLLQLVNPNILGGYTRFLQRFAPEKAYNHEKVQSYNKKSWGKPLNRTFPQEEKADKNDLFLLHNVLARTVMLRRLKKDVAPELPKKIRKVFRIKIEERSFWKAEKELRERIKESLGKQGIKGGIIDMHSYSRMRRLVGTAKLEHICEWITDFLKESTGKLVVTGWHKDIMKELHAKFPDSYLITGEVSTVKKHVIGKAFQSETGGKRILFGNIKSISTGINLTAADTMLNVELPYTGADLSQVEDRIHRLSQKAKKVMYVYFVVQDSLEENLLRYISEKQTLLGAVIDNKEVETLEDIVEDAPNTRLMKRLLLD